MSESGLFARKSGVLRGLIVAGVAMVLIGAGLIWIFADKSQVATDDAYVQADKTLVSPKVRGLVLQVLARENQAVKPGDPLVRLDPEEFDLRLTAARGDVMAADAAESAARAGLARMDTEAKLAGDQLKAAQTLAGPKGLSDPLLRQAFETARGQGLVAARTRGEIEAALQQARAAQFRARAQLDGAKREKDHTLVTAPAGGIIADIQAVPGGFVQPGMKLMTIVSTGAPYVVANFKETQTGRMHAGETASIRFDALPGQAFTGKVESLAPGSGSEFSLLPFEPGSGNFTKIVQRVAVRIVLDPGQPGLSDLRAGLSAQVKVRLAPAR